MNEVTQDGNVVRVEFTGSALGLFGRSLLMGLLSALVIPAPWMAVWFYRWSVSKVRLSDNTQVSFAGQGNDIWFPIMAIMAMSLVGHFVPFLPLLLIPVNCYLYLIIARWFWKNVQPSCGTQAAFVGKYLPYLGWTLLTMVSIYTIIGWAWVNVAFIRWFFRNIQGNNHIVEFHGNGWNVLWRTIAFVLSCVIIIPIPWTALWLVKWYMANISIRKVAI